MTGNWFVHILNLFLFLAALGLHGCEGFLQLWRAGATLWCTGFSLRWLLLLQSMGSRCAGFSSCGSWAPEHRLSSCGARAQLLHGTWDLPRPGPEPVSPALAGRLPTTAPPGKPSYFIFNPYSVLGNCTFLGIFPFFLLVHLISVQMFVIISDDPLCFSGVSLLFLL